MKVFAFGIAARNGHVVPADHPAIPDDARQILAQLLKRSDRDGSLSVVYDPAGCCSRIIEMSGCRKTDSIDIFESRQIQRAWVDVGSTGYFDVGSRIESLYLLRFDQSNESLDPSIKWLPRRFDSVDFQLSHAGEKVSLSNGVEARVEIYRRRLSAVRD